MLARLGIVTPTPVQQQAIPSAVAGRDILAVAETGTGKTLAFGLPALTRLTAAEKGRNRMLVLTPTRELAQQVQQSIEPFAKAMGLRSTAIVGGVGMQPQIQALRQGVDIVVATPGRLLDHMNQRTVRFNHLSVLVLDEADRMLDMGFIPDIRRIVGTLPTERQTMLFSATFPPEIERLAQEFLRDVHRVQVSARTAPAVGVNQHVYPVEANAKTGLLSDLLQKEEVTSAIVFIRTKHRTDRIARQLQQAGILAEAIHGGRSQNQRDRALAGFRNGKFNVLVATDVAARGIDVRGVSHVVNYDIPRSYEDYVHRIGRTGRAEATGDAFTFVTPEDVKELSAIEEGLGRRIPHVGWDGATVLPELPARNARASRPSRGNKPNGRPKQQHGGNGGNRPFRKTAAGNDNRKSTPEQRNGGAKPADRDKVPSANAQRNGASKKYYGKGKPGKPVRAFNERPAHRMEKPAPALVIVPSEPDTQAKDTSKVKRGTRAWRRLFKIREQAVGE